MEAGGHFQWPLLCDAHGDTTIRRSLWRIRAHAPILSIMLWVRVIIGWAVPGDRFVTGQVRGAVFVHYSRT
jgi:hypothetical protein